MFSMLRMLLHTLCPIERLSSELGRKASIYHLPLDTNRLKAAILPVSRWTSFIPDGDGISSTTFILFGFASIPLWLTMKPKNFSADTPKAHLAGFSFML